MSKYYAKSHEVITIEGDIARLSISNHAIEQLGDVVFVELPIVGQEVEVGESFIVIETVKSASDIYAPVSGEVIELNEEIEDRPAIVNDLVESTGWFVKIRMSDPSQVETLMSESDYVASIN